jgi:hypothetical protein
MRFLEAARRLSDQHLCGTDEDAGFVRVAVDDAKRR